jgi:DNA repair protein RadC
MKTLFGKMSYNERADQLLKSKGAEHLSDPDLVAVILQSLQCSNTDGLMVYNVLTSIDQSCGDGLVYKDLLNLGLNETAAAVLISSFELARRNFFPKKQVIESPLDVYKIVHHYANRVEENLICITLNGAQEVIKMRVVSTGIVNQAIIHPREVFSYSLEDRATGIILAHNHPSGNVYPSSEDLASTSRLVQAGKLLNIPVLDHIIFSHDGYFSFIENGKIPGNE